MPPGASFPNVSQKSLPMTWAELAVLSFDRPLTFILNNFTLNYLWLIHGVFLLVVKK